MKMGYKKSEITDLAKLCAKNQIINEIMIAEEIAHSDIGREFSRPMDENLLLEIEKKYAKLVIVLAFAYEKMVLLMCWRRT